MTDTDEILLFLVEDILGAHRPTKFNNPQKYFNCKSPKCIHDYNKYNLAYKADERVFKCFKCNMKGSIHKLVSYYGNNAHKKQLKLALPYYIESRSYFDKPNFDSITCELPEEFISLSEKRNSFKYKQALEYITKTRKISLDEIKKYNIGYTEEGKYKLRIIIPSYNEQNKVNYFEARTFWDKVKITYLKPDKPDKQNIIFFENMINWDLPVYLVEGVFDAIRLPNAIPMLGKIPSFYLISKLMQQNSKVILCLDEDAIQDAFEIYEDLSSLGLDIYFIDMTGRGDISKIYEDFGKNGIINLLKTVQKINFENYFKKLLKYGG